MATLSIPLSGLRKKEPPSPLFYFNKRHLADLRCLLNRGLNHGEQIAWLSSHSAVRTGPQHTFPRTTVRCSPQPLASQTRPVISLKKLSGPVIDQLEGQYSIFVLFLWLLLHYQMKIQIYTWILHFIFSCSLFFECQTFFSLYYQVLK